MDNLNKNYEYMLQLFKELFKDIAFNCKELENIKIYNLIPVRYKLDNTNYYYNTCNIENGIINYLLKLFVKNFIKLKKFSFLTTSGDQNKTQRNLNNYNFEVSYRQGINNPQQLTKINNTNR